MNKDKTLKVIDLIILIIIALVCAGNTCFAIIKGLEVDYSLMSFVLLFAMSLHFICSVYIEMDYLKKQDDISKKIDTSTNTIINSLKGVEIKFFEHIEEVDFYIAERISTAKKCVYDLNWQDFLKTNPSPRNPIDREYTESAIDKSIKTFCAEKNSKVYREIFTFSYPKNLPKLINHITYGSKYSCSYFDNLKHPKFPKLQFVIIDDEEVIFVSSAYRPNFCSIRDKRLVSIFNNYFDQAWQLSQIIKDKSDLKQDVLDKINAKYFR